MSIPRSAVRGLTTCRTRPHTPWRTLSLFLPPSQIEKRNSEYIRRMYGPDFYITHIDKTGRSASRTLPMSELCKAALLPTEANRRLTFIPAARMQMLRVTGKSEKYT